jgi:3-hydroxyacyl-CoA dehydrogenase/3-hydroxy-2-methylbutyryl-CoA dehydrogenase
VACSSEVSSDVEPHVKRQIIDSNNDPLSLDLWDFTLAVNLTGTFNLTRLALKHLVTVPPEGPDGERGIICVHAFFFTLCNRQFEGQPGQVAYAASKGALASMTLPMARDLARHAIRIVTIAPGAFSSAMTAQLPEKARRSLEGNGGLVYPQRFGNPNEFAKTVRWAIEVPYVNGEVVRLSGAGRLPGKL